MDKVYFEMWLEVDKAEEVVEKLDQMATKFLKGRKADIGSAGFHIVFKGVGREVRFYGDKFIPETEEEARERKNREYEEYIRDVWRQAEEDEKKWAEAERKRIEDMAAYQEDLERRFEDLRRQEEEWKIEREERLLPD